jgi:hypothetical protein
LIKQAGRTKYQFWDINKTRPPSLNNF